MLQTVGSTLLHPVDSAQRHCAIGQLLTKVLMLNLQGQIGDTLCHTFSWEAAVICHTLLVSLTQAQDCTNKMAECASLCYPGSACSS